MISRMSFGPILYSLTPERVIKTLFSSGVAISAAASEEIKFSVIDNLDKKDFCCPPGHIFIPSPKHAAKTSILLSLSMSPVIMS